MITDEELSKLQEFVPYAQKHPHASKGYVVGMRRKTARDELDERDVYLSKHQVIEFIQSRAAGVQGVGLTQEAVAEAMKRWPDAQPAIIFMAGAVGALAPITANDIAWANTEIATPHPPKDANSDIVREAIAILRDMPTDRIEYNEELSALIRKLKPASPKDAGAVPLPEVAATVCLTPDGYAHGHMLDLQVQVAPTTTFAIGDKLCRWNDAIKYGNAREAEAFAASDAQAQTDGALIKALTERNQELEREAAGRADAVPNCTCPSGDGSLRHPCPQHPPAEPAARAQVGALGFARPAELDDVRRNKDSHAAIAIFLQPEKSDAHSVPIYTHPSPAHAGAGAEAMKIARQVGMYCADGKVSFGSPLWCFKPDELIEFARRLAGGDHANG